MFGCRADSTWAEGAIRWVRPARCSQARSNDPRPAGIVPTIGSRNKPRKVGALPAPQTVRTGQLAQAPMETTCPGWVEGTNRWSTSTNDYQTSSRMAHLPRASARHRRRAAHKLRVGQGAHERSPHRRRGACRSGALAAVRGEPKERPRSLLRVRASTWPRAAAVQVVEAKSEPSPLRCLIRHSHRESA